MRSAGAPNPMATTSCMMSVCPVASAISAEISISRGAASGKDSSMPPIAPRSLRMKRDRSGIAATVSMLAPTSADSAMPKVIGAGGRSEEHTSELQSLMRISYAVFCLKKNKQHQTKHEEVQKKQNNTIDNNYN